MANNPVDIDSISWSAARIGELLENLALRANLLSHPIDLAVLPDSLLLSKDADFAKWVDSAAGHLNLEVEPVTTMFSNVDGFIHAAAPAIIQLPKTDHAENHRFIALVRGGHRKTSLLIPNLRVRKFSNKILRDILCLPFEQVIGEDLNLLLHEAEVPLERIGKAKDTILKEQLGSTRIDVGWLLRKPAGANIWSQFRHAGINKPVFILLGMYFIQQILTLASWVVIGRGIFQGHFDFNRNLD